jgi:hypothetical protein
MRKQVERTSRRLVKQPLISTATYQNNNDEQIGVRNHQSKQVITSLEPKAPTEKNMQKAINMTTIAIRKLQALIGTAKYQKKNDEKKCWYKKSSKQQQPSHKHRHHKNMQTSAWQVSQNETSV